MEAIKNTAARGWKWVKNKTQAGVAFVTEKLPTASLSLEPVNWPWKYWLKHADLVALLTLIILLGYHQYVDDFTLWAEDRYICPDYYACYRKTFTDHFNYSVSLDATLGLS